jgi:hypothetical protein
VNPTPTITWSPWTPLHPETVSNPVPAVAGLYRLRTNHDDILDYIGQTGAGAMTLRRRVAMLAGMWRDEMPYRDPHTAAPAMWAWLRSGRHSPEVSTSPVTADTPARKALEALAISEHRWAHRCSPRWNFGRRPPGYRMSSANNRRLAETGRRFRGGVTDEPGVSHIPGIAPLSLPGDDPASREWGGLPWTPWAFIRDGVPDMLHGIYRLRHQGNTELLYIGEGHIPARLVSHLAKVNRPDHRQAGPLGGGLLQSSWVEGDWPRHQRLELENDLIANHLQMHGQAPAAQFLG